jgi:catechol 2,3-dioxygenase-like lactoylglutathione lyase family enzyme
MALINSAELPDPHWYIAALRRPVSNLEHSIEFYTRALGFSVEPGACMDSTRCVSLRLGDERILLEEVVCELGQHPILAEGPDTRFQHAAIVVSDMKAAYDQLQQFAQCAITRGGPQRLPAAANHVTAFKFRDPDGHPLELISFPKGVGNQRWHTGTHDRPTLGIDHFAISVSSIERSIAFYESTFGFAVAAQQVNSGVEQARLDGLDTSVVEVVALKANKVDTPHLELLAYRQPAARTYPTSASVRPLDCVVLVPITRSTTQPNQRQGKDPDGHAFCYEST